MKKAFSIFLSLLMMVAMLHISVATHYCGGKEVATTVSLGGKLASCGMTEDEIPLQGTYFTSLCCEDLVTFCGISSNYTPTYSFLPESYQHNFQVLIPVKLSVKCHPNNISLYSNASPPGALMSTNVDLTSICVFRI